MRIETLIDTVLFLVKQFENGILVQTELAFLWQ